MYRQSDSLITDGYIEHLADAVREAVKKQCPLWEALGIRVQLDKIDPGYPRFDTWVAVQAWGHCCADPDSDYLLVSRVRLSLDLSQDLASTIPQIRLHYRYGVLRHFQFSLACKRASAELYRAEKSRLILEGISQND